MKPVLSFVEGRSAPNRNGLNPQETSGKRLISSREKGMGRKGAYITSNLQPSTSNPKLVPDSGLSTTQSGDRGSAIQNDEVEVSNPKSKIANRKLEYGFTVASYDRTKDLIIDPLLASTYLGGFGWESGSSLTLDTSGNVYVMGYTYSSDFPTTSGAYDTSYDGCCVDVFISKLDGNLSAGTAQPPTVTTGDAADITVNTATLKGVVNANGLTATAWFEYGDTSGGPYSHTTTQTVTGTSDTPISAPLSGLSAGTKYYYRLVAENTAGKTEGSEKTFTTSSETSVQPPVFGLTIITHGYQLFGAYPVWVDEMAEAIANRFGGADKMPVYSMKMVEDNKGKIIAEDLVKVTSAPDFKSAGGAIFR
ncbi:MAG: SBBP repeat-containing protein [Candidatus Brocadia sp.]